VLVDGRRQTPVNGTGVVDINSIPSAAIDRVEIITGGASSTYGADAVGGVVNFILKNDFEGVTLDGQYGISERGDGRRIPRLRPDRGEHLGRPRQRDARARALRPQRGQAVLAAVVRGALFEPRHARQHDLRLRTDLLPVSPPRPGGRRTAGQPSQAVLNTMFRAKGAPATQPNGTALNIR
jgi:hypothetical protein